MARKAKEEVATSLIPQVEKLSLDEKKSLCSYCFKKDSGLIRCSACKEACYCNKSCQKKHWDNYHRFTCQPGGTPTVEQILENFGLIVKDGINGRGMFSTRKIKKGERIICEKPVLLFVRTEDQAALSPEDRAKLPITLRNRYDVLPTTVRSSIDSLYSHEENNLREKVELNMIPLGPESKICGVFRTIARSNHCCTPNANYAWNSNKGFEEVIALRDIEPDEEIFVYYFNILVAYDVRKSSMKTWSSRCFCQTCQNPDPINEAIRIKCKKLNEDIYEAIEDLQDYKKAREYAISRLILLNRLDWTLDELFHTQKQILDCCLKLNDKVGAKKWREACLTSFQNSWGLDHPDALKFQQEYDDIELLTEFR